MHAQLGLPDKSCAFKVYSVKKDLFESKFFSIHSITEQKFISFIISLLIIIYPILDQSV